MRVVPGQGAARLRAPRVSRSSARLAQRKLETLMKRIRACWRRRESAGCQCTEVAAVLNRRATRFVTRHDTLPLVT